jgi:hypothetical protein
MFVLCMGRSAKVIRIVEMGRHWAGARVIALALALVGCGSGGGGDSGQAGNGGTIG